MTDAVMTIGAAPCIGWLRLAVIAIGTEIGGFVIVTAAGETGVTASTVGLGLRGGIGGTAVRAGRAVAVGGGAAGAAGGEPRRSAF